jgi:hypothetical protein
MIRRRRRKTHIPPAPAEPKILNPSAIPDRLFVTPAELADGLKISRQTLWTWTKRWLAGDKSYQIHPVVFSYQADGLTPATVRYRVDELGIYPGTFLSRYRKARRAEAKEYRQQARARAKAMKATAGGVER